jgi:FAD/FMN-containing dehydrogenase
VAVDRLLASYRAIPPGATVRLAKPTSNLFRARAKISVKGLDTTGLTGVISVDPEARTADVAGMCTYEDLVAATLPYGLSPLVVPQLKTITLGGAVTGLGIESASFRNGLPHESVLELDILTGAGEVVTASRDQHADLFRAFPNSYGTLGYSVRLKIELEPVKPFVSLKHIRFHEVTDLVAAMDRIIETGGHDGVPVDYLDGVVFSADESYLCLGMQTTTPGPVSDYTGQHIYYRSIQHARGEKHDRLTIHDYLWRWDTDWFWCSKNLLAQNPLVRRLYGRDRLGSKTYGKVMRWNSRVGLTRVIDRLRGLHGESVIQDVDIPIENAPEFLDFLAREIGIWPVWMCPIVPRENCDLFSLYPMAPKIYVNFGFWDVVRRREPHEPGHFNRAIEALVEKLGGIKSLYSTSYYEREAFDRIYGGSAYAALKARYDPAGTFPTLYEKCVLRQ